MSLGIRQEQKIRTRRGLILSATKLFSKHGISGTTTAAVANEQKVSHGTVFIHFKTRDDLVLAVIDHLGAELAKEFDEVLSQSMSFMEILRAHLKVLAEYEEFYFRLLTEMPHLPQKVKGTAFLINASVSWYMFEAAKSLMSRGELRNLERPMLFNTWMALIQYYVVHRDVFSNKKPILSEQAEVILNHYLSLVKGSK